MEIVLSHILPNTSLDFGVHLGALAASLVRLVAGAVLGAIDVPFHFNARGPDFGGGVGNIMAAALQTKGMVDQAKILKDFKEQLIWIAALGWLFSLCMGLGAAAVFGNYKQGLYLLLGPPLFFYMIETTISTDGTKLMIGDRVVTEGIQDQNRLLRWIRAIDGKVSKDKAGNQTISNAGTANISFFFGIFDWMVTEMTQKMVSVIMDTKNRNDLRFVARERARSFMLQSVPVESPLSSLIVNYHYGECAEAIDALQLSNARHPVSPVQYRPTTDIDNAAKRIKDAKWDKKYITLDNEVRRFLIGMKDTVIDEKGTKFNAATPVPFNDPTDQQPVSCQQIWGWVRSSLFFFALERMKPESFQANFPDTESGTPWAKVYEDVKKWLLGAPPGGQPSNLDPQQVLAAFLYKNAVVDTTHTALQSQVFSRAPFNEKQYEAVFGDLGNAEAHGGYFKLRYFATSIPYIQGLLLYLLTISFPFFAIFLVLPGRATSFFVWCSLWVWVKTWDIGFALVFVARDIFWHFFNNRVNVFQQRINWEFPSDVINVAFNNDPLLSENTYWVLISGLTLSVPMLTAHCCMGATGLFDMFKNSIDQTANRFGQVEANRARRRIANEIEDQMNKQNFLAGATYARAHMDQGMRPIIQGKDENGKPNGTYSFGPPTGAMTGIGEPLHGGAIASDGKITSASLTKAVHGMGGRPLQVGASFHLGQFLNNNGDPAFTRMMQKSLDETNKQEAFNKQYNAGMHTGGKIPLDAQKRPEKIFNPFRGMLGMEQKMDKTALDRHASDTAALFGKDSSQHKAALAAAANGQTWGQFFQREQTAARDMSERLTVVSRRKMFGQAQGGDGGAGALASFNEQQQTLAMHARNVFDGTNLGAVPIAGPNMLMRASAGTSRPNRIGLTFEGNLFKSGRGSDPRATGGSGPDADAGRDNVEGN